MSLTAKTEPHTTAHRRIDWVDQVKGFTIFLVVYGHNFPFCEKYIYSFHMPLFIMAAGFFHGKTSAWVQTKKRFKALILPYFLWSLFLFAVWFFVTRHYGDSATLGLSPTKNFIGVVTAQGDRAYMDWGIPMWFLPMLFVTSVVMSWVLAFKNTVGQIVSISVLVILGFIYAHLSSVRLPWSADIALVALFFYALGFYCFRWLAALSKNLTFVVLIVCALLHTLLYGLNLKIDMYRAIYGNPALFVLAGVTGSLMVLCFFKLFPVFKFLGFIGQFSLTILALQLLAMTAIKFVLMLGLGQTDFNFSETERFAYAIVQIAMMVPVFLLINRYLPVLNGGPKKI
ncbi:acyltransferase family protein [Flavobacterium caeni]|uniref:Fucose 4-O-acetylase n=1 Tax=Flavobacterium caeni TaxID=490189 RepID=A0A1G5CK49_9FLAO|nr:acyltransferase family protein [Flavobacterium caeni]SCY02668.1 Fucose 4-O-acetylase [Flavobacterium caeni]